MNKNTIGILNLLVPTMLTIFTLILNKEKRMCITKSNYFLPGNGELMTLKKFLTFIGYILLYISLVGIYILIFIGLNHLINYISKSNKYYYYYLGIYLFFTYFYLFLLVILGTRKLKDENSDKYDKQMNNKRIIRRVLILLILFVTMLSGYGFMSIIDNNNIYDISTGIFFIFISATTYIFISIMFSNLTVNCSSFYKFKIYFNNNKSVECDEIIDIGKKLLLKKYCKNSNPKRVNIIEISKSNVFYVKSLITYKQYPSKKHTNKKKKRTKFLKFLPLSKK